MIYRIVILGPQGSGKGTQAELLAKRLGIPAISMGALWRDEIERGTDLGKTAKSYLDQGKLAPSELTNQLMVARIAQNDCASGFVIDGYPRDQVQFAASENFLNLSHVIELEISDEVSLRRLGGRRVCSKCGTNYHVDFKPPKREGICDVEGARLEIRHDDTPDAIRTRLAIYHKETEPILKVYSQKGIVHRVNGESSISSVHEEIVRALG